MATTPHGQSNRRFIWVIKLDRIKKAIEKPAPPDTHNADIEPLLRTSPRRQGCPRRDNCPASSQILTTASQASGWDASIDLFSTQPIVNSQSPSQNTSIDLFSP